MTAPQTRHPNSLDHISGQASSFNASSPPCRADSAASNLADTAKSQSNPGQVGSQDPFTYYKAFLSTSVPSGSSPIQHNSGYIGHPEPAESQITHYVGNQQQLGVRSRPLNHLAVRLANRSNGETLATIIEQGSYSTLDSYKSHLSVARFPSIRVIENVSPKRSACRISQGRAEQSLQNIQEDCHPEHGLPIQEGSHTTPDESHDHPNATYDADTQIKSSSLESQHTPTTPSDAVSHNVKNRGLVGFFRGVLHNVRSGSHPESRTPSISNLLRFEDHRESGDKNLASSNTPHGDSDLGQELDGGVYASGSTQTSASALLTTSDHLELTPEMQNKSAIGLSTGCGPSVCADHSMQNYSPLINEPKIGFDPASHLLRPRNVTRDLPSSARPVPPGTRDAAAQVPNTDGILITHKHSKGDISARYVINAAPISFNNAPSLRELDRTRAASRSASFCSTMSTSYSGTVLGVDLDLLQDLPSSVRRSPTPVWFTPQMDELERQASSSESPRPQRNIAADPSRHSITSSALPTLLPVAEASGIVRPNYTTPKLSFFSPSGNLIQSEESSASGDSQSDYHSSPTIKTSYYNNPTPTSAYDGLLVLSGLPRAIPPMVPMTTPPLPPKSISQLPAHMKHRRNYHHAEKTQISPSQTIIRTAPKVKGCGGMVSNQNSFTPRSGVCKTKSTNYPEPCKSKPQSFACRFKMEISRSRSKSLASCGKSQKGKTPQKRNTASPSKPCPQQPTATRKARTSERFGPLAGQALRICFCQPHDSAGELGCPAEKGCTGIAKSIGKQCDNAGYAQPAGEAGTENVRVVSSGKQRSSQSGKRRRSDSAASIGLMVDVLGEVIDKD